MPDNVGKLNQRQILATETGCWKKFEIPEFGGNTEKKALSL
jgi:hypothetical protein